MWIAARDPDSHDFAVRSGCNVMVTPLMKGDDEVDDLHRTFQAAVDNHPDGRILSHTQAACLRRRAGASRCWSGRSPETADRRIDSRGPAGSRLRTGGTSRASLGTWTPGAVGPARPR